MTYLWSLLGSFLAVGCEVLFKTKGTYTPYIGLLWPAALGINYCIFKIVTGTPTLIVALLVFSLTNIMLRVALSLATGATVGPGTWAAVALITLANIARYLWK